jgi:hypothetical protein
VLGEEAVCASGYVRIIEDERGPVFYPPRRQSGSASVGDEPAGAR